MQNEHKVVRLQLQTLDAHNGYLLERMSPDDVVPHLIQRRLLTQNEAGEVREETSRQEKVFVIIDKIRRHKKDKKYGVGKLPTFCAALLSAGQPHVSQRLLKSESGTHKHHS